MPMIQAIIDSFIHTYHTAYMNAWVHVCNTAYMVASIRADKTNQLIVWLADGLCDWQTED